jgi:hypothetical protein
MRIALSALTTFTALAIGISVVQYHRSPTHTDLTSITADPQGLDGKLVEFESYAHMDPAGELILGEPFEKPERITFAKLQQGIDGPLRAELGGTKGYDERTYKRVRVIAQGYIQDNSVIASDGETFTLRNASISLIGPVETYNRPPDN